ncbi:MAG: BatA and WFA domain-containing protein [Gemmatimonadales bacterium]
MGVSLLAPLFLAGLIAVAVPILVHLTNRDRKDVVLFPSLKFLTKLPYRQVRRQRIQHWFLFALRTLAVVLLVAAFTRPLIDGPIVGVTNDDPGREVVIALDRSYSMAYGDTWERALDAAREAVAGLPPNTRMSLLTFAEQAQVAAAPTLDHLALTRALDTLTPGSGRTRFASAIQLANQVLLESPLAQREVVLISDLQARAWDRSSRNQLVSGTALTIVDLSTPDPANVMIAGIEVHRLQSGGRQSMILSARVVNQGGDPVIDLPITLYLNGQEMATERISLDADGSRTIQLGPVAQPSELTRATIRVSDDLLAPDNVFRLALSPRPPLSVLLVESPDARPEGSLYLREALQIAEDPVFDVTIKRTRQVRAGDIAAAAVVILHDSPFPGGAAGQALVDHVVNGGGLWIILGGRSNLRSWPETAATLMPGRWRRTVDRLDVQGISLASVDYHHPAFQIFSGPDDGNVAGPRFYRYRPIVLEDSAIAIARYTDGAVALAGRRAGEGRVLQFGSPFDNRWSNLPVHPVFLPFVHQVTQFLAGGLAVDPWREAGQVVDLREVLRDMEIDPDTLTREVIVESPSGNRREVDPGSDEPFVTLSEAGFYEVYPLGRERSAYPVAVNVDRRESDLARLDPEAFVAASTAPDTLAASIAAAGGGRATLTPAERERRQGVWWYLVLGALLLLAAESLWSNRPAQGHPAPVAGGRIVKE